MASFGLDDLAQIEKNNRTSFVLKSSIEKVKKDGSGKQRSDIDITESMGQSENRLDLNDKYLDDLFDGVRSH